MDYQERLDRTYVLVAAFLENGVRQITCDGEKPVTDSDIRVLRSSTDDYLSRLSGAGLIRGGITHSVRTCKNKCCINVWLRLCLEEEGQDGLMGLFYKKESSILKAIEKVVEECATDGSDIANEQIDQSNVLRPSPGNAHPELN